MLHHKKKYQEDPKLKKSNDEAAIKKINEATLLGIKQGEAASKLLHKNAKVQTEEQTTVAVE